MHTQTIVPVDIRSPILILRHVPVISYSEKLSGSTRQVLSGVEREEGRVFGVSPKKASWH